MMLRSIISAICFCAATTVFTFGITAAAPTSSADASNSLAMIVANKRPAPKFHGTTVISPPGLWLTYAAVYISARMSQPSRNAITKDAPRDELLSLANAMGYSKKPLHDRVLSDAAELKATARGSDIAMRLWTHEAGDLDGATRSELGRLGVTISSEPMNRTTKARLDSWPNQLSNGIFDSLGSEVSGFSTGILFTSVEHRLAFPSSFREDSVASPSIIPTTEGGVASLPGKPIGYYSDATGITGIQLDAASGRIFLFTGSPDDLRRMLDGLSTSKWTEMKGRFKPQRGRVVDAFRSQTAYDFLSLVRLGNLKLWGGSVGEALQRGSINFDGNEIDLFAGTEYVAGGCCGDYAVNQQTESQFQWSSLAPLVFID